ncbi:2-isopropylmalate synthase/homocitrate synthase family protein [Desulfovibrio sp. X2]|uniref:citramalate synthase n=1 Tax=Desulfovibrio sp. X2 TaxID=941449 RepID=UPI0003587FD6|nr:citramalate synthase [Desulfovibrio sp. X2]EPR42340.1 2-isopropylmalate synthase/homocitrate synthase family protein [Desulfovibrio sp. X2]
MSRIQVYDTTLRDGTQAEEINLTLDDKVLIAKKLDELGVDYIEGGWPGSNPTDKQFFREIGSFTFAHAAIAAFGSTHAAKNTAENDPNLKALVESKAQVATIVGKTWDLHVKEALRIPLERNLELIRDSVRFLKPYFQEVFYDAEHFFDALKAGPDYAISCLRAAHEAGADVLVLCDTNGGILPHDLGPAFEMVRKTLPEARLSFHGHNDSGMAVANTVEAVRLGAVQVQGTMNGYGERCGNADLCAVIPNLELKLGHQCLPEGNLEHLTQISHYISEVVNLRPFLRQPFVGRSAFAHKGGIHVSAVLRNSRTYEHVPPESVGNVQRVILSDLAGRSNILAMAQRYYKDLDKNDPCVETLLAEIKEREALGYEYSVAEASFILLFFRTMGWSKHYFELVNFRVLDGKRGGEDPISEATVQVKVQGRNVHTAADGRGPVNALDNALRKALCTAYPHLNEMKLVDFKVRVLSGYARETGGTASNVRVLIESADKTEKWTTVGLSHNIIVASWFALADSITYKLFKDDPQKWPHKASL